MVKMRQLMSMTANTTLEDITFALDSHFQQNYRKIILN